MNDWICELFAPFLYSSDVRSHRSVLEREMMLGVKDEVIERDVVGLLIMSRRSGIEVDMWKMLVFLEIWVRIFCMERMGKVEEDWCECSVIMLFLMSGVKEKGV